MEIVVTVFAAFVAAGCFLAILSKNKDSKKDASDELEEKQE